MRAKYEAISLLISLLGLFPIANDSIAAVFSRRVGLIHYRLPVDVHVTITVYDRPGRNVMTILDESKTAGYHEVSFDGSIFASGMYVYVMTAGHYRAVNRMLLLK